MENKEDMLLLMLLNELILDTGISFSNKDGENKNFETIQEILEDEKVKDKFYEVLLNTLEDTLKTKYNI